MTHALAPRLVPLGGPRAMTVRRTLPHRDRTLVGPWCFVDHYGPDDVAVTGGMLLPPHPHIGLATVSWLFDGELEHRDSLGTSVVVRPSELNLMTAGDGIAHSEVSTDATTTLRGAQLWLALPSGSRGVAPRFEHHAPTPEQDEHGTLRVAIGSLQGVTFPVEVESPTVAAELVVRPEAERAVRLDPAYEHAVLVDCGVVVVDGHVVAPGSLRLLDAGRTNLGVRAGAHGARLLLIGGEPMDESLVMWWNFVGGSDEEVRAARADWMTAIGADDDGDRPERFGAVPGWPATSVLPAPTLPAAPMRPRPPRRS